MSGSRITISLPEATLRRVVAAAARLGLSPSEFAVRAAERWLDALEDDGTTDAINRTLDGVMPDHVLTDAAAANLFANEVD